LEKGKRLSSHRDLWEHKEEVIREFGEWIRDSWNAAAHMHINFYEDWAREEDVRNAYNKVLRLVEEVRKNIKT